MTTEGEVKMASTGADAPPDSPGVLVFPPVLFLGSLLVGGLLQHFWPVHLPGMPWVRIAGALLAVAGGTVVLWGRTVMLAAGTNIIPTRPVLAFVSSGPFRFTRNPLYLGNSVVYVGLTLIFNAVWLLVPFVPALVILQWGVIRREERFLEGKFGDTYLNYKTRVRRWL